VIFGGNINCLIIYRAQEIHQDTSDQSFPAFTVLFGLASFLYYFPQDGLSLSVSSSFSFCDSLHFPFLSLAFFFLPPFVARLSCGPALPIHNKGIARLLRVSQSGNSSQTPCIWIHAPTEWEICVHIGTPCTKPSVPWRNPEEGSANFGKASGLLVEMLKFGMLECQNVRDG
jgi:hypothetical protein